jgi:hypothetical protein
MGKTKGYRNHPQLDRFKQHLDPQAAMGFYLQKIYEEAVKRGYAFNAKKIASCPSKVQRIKLTKGQLAFEVQHLSGKLKKRDPRKYSSILLIKNHRPHPLFKLAEGDVSGWEKGGAR